MTQELLSARRERARLRRKFLREQVKFIDINELRLCSKCGVEKKTSEFGRDNRGKVEKICLPCERKLHAYYRKKRWEKMTELEKRAWRDRRNSTIKPGTLRTKYGITLDEYNRLIASQSHTCAICHGGFTGRGPCVDHCHSTGKVRGILCSRCNSAIGMMEDVPERLEAAANYIRRFRK